jgi:hypothetical protein
MPPRRAFIDDAAVALLRALLQAARPHGRALNDEWAGQPVKHVFWIVPLFGQPPRVQESFVNGVPQLVGTKSVKNGDEPALNPVSLPIA